MVSAPMASDGAFADLRKLADSFAMVPAMPGATSGVRVERLARRLGALAVPLLGRELAGPDAHRRELAREALADLSRIDEGPAAAALRARVVEELRLVAARGADDDAKAAALGLLAELGEHATVRFADPSAMQRRSALALAAQLDTAADVASTADFMIRQLGEAALEQIIEILVEAAPAAARRLAGELAARLDLAAPVRDRLEALVAPLPQVHAPLRRASRPARVAVLVDAAARLVVVAVRRAPGARRYRRWAVLIGASGRIEECLHEEEGGETGDAAPLIASLCADGYRVASSSLEHARGVIARAARLTTVPPESLPSAYYLGRDLLDLDDAHLGDRRRGDPAALALGRAIELLGRGEAARAQALLTGCDPLHPDVAGALAACLLAQGDDAGALEHLARASAAEPEWPLHHWNTAIALQRLGDAAACYQALRRFLSTSGAPSGLAADPDQLTRIVCAERMLAELEREARLAGRKLGPRRRQTRHREQK